MFLIEKMVQGIGASKMDEDFFSKNALTYSRFSGWWRGRWKRGWRWWPRRRGGREDCEWVNFYFKAHSHELRLIPAAAADGCVSAEIGIFLFLCTSHFCRSHTRQTHHTQPNTSNTACLNEPLQTCCKSAETFKSQLLQIIGNFSYYLQHNLALCNSHCNSD